ncbi:MAG: hypothetical protein Ct9H300mP28_22890 [Pseudomonadota bacterium]|nr:MAG: hypothetical protein Ct9H300mP28_22890 [Pseudomonadota bacterium]
MKRKLALNFMGTKSLGKLPRHIDTEIGQTKLTQPGPFQKSRSLTDQAQCAFENYRTETLYS